jgi:hypothetical protein
MNIDSDQSMTPFLSKGKEHNNEKVSRPVAKSFTPLCTRNSYTKNVIAIPENTLNNLANSCTSPRAAPPKARIHG